jgi:hypothetical protein
VGIARDSIPLSSSVEATHARISFGRAVTARTDTQAVRVAAPPRPRAAQTDALEALVKEVRVAWHTAMPDCPSEPVGRPAKRGRRRPQSDPGAPNAAGGLKPVLRVEGARRLLELLHEMPPRALGRRVWKSSKPTHVGRRSILAIRVPG